MKTTLFTFFATVLMQINLISAQTARVQVIHNAADAAAASVDVWLDNTPLLTDFNFRQASPFIDAPAGVDFDITIQPAGSADTTDAVARFTYNLTEGETYILVANGTVSASGYDPAKPFNIDVKAMGREMASSTGNTDVLVYHGSTDAPNVQIAEKTAGVLVNDIAYGEFAGYLELLATDYVIDINAGQVSSTVASYEAPLSTLDLGGQAITVLASGFLNPANNSDGPAFGLYVALASGGDLIALPTYEMPTARVQVIHNAADAAAASVDVWLDNTPLLTDFNFRQASPFIDAPAGVDFDITIQPAGSTDTTNAVARFTYNLTEGETYILVANGTVSASGYDPAKTFNIDVKAMGREMASSTGNTDVLVYHGSTDAPVVDIYEKTAGQLLNDLAYSQFSAYLELPTADYVIEVRDETGENTVASYSAPLSTLGLDDAAITVLASGFLNPANNSDGPAFGLYVALASGGALVELPAYTSIASENNFNSLAIYPNPAKENFTINFGNKIEDNTQVEIINLLGVVVYSDVLNSGINSKTIDVSNLNTGVYFVSVNTQGKQNVTKLQVIR